VLKRVAALIQEQTRETDHVARYGGEEFAVLLPETDAQGADILAERIREAVAGEAWPLRSVTVSVGVNTLPPECLSEAGLVSGADQALYQSKHNGRNRVTHHVPLEQSAAVRSPG
jgi:diguanylate cyclase (GGDEF)-like protein